MKPAPAAPSFTSPASQRPKETMMTPVPKFLCHDRWPHHNPFPDRAVWFHGTTAFFEGPPEALEDCLSNSQHWNTSIGPHFASHPDSANLFTGKCEHAHDLDEDEHPRVIPVRLLSRKSRHFSSEHELAQLAVSLMAERRLQEDPAATPHAEYGTHADETEWLIQDAYGHEQVAYATLMREHLISESYDAVTYVNDHEGAIGAISLDKTQIQGLYARWDAPVSWTDFTVPPSPSHSYKRKW